jgi:putative tricarboxylic transport membrane protein
VAIQLYPTRNSTIGGDHTMPAVLGTVMIVLGILLLLKSEALKPVFPNKKAMRVLLGSLVR